MAEEQDPAAGISRRGFLKGVGGGLLGGAALNEGLIGAQVAAAAGPEALKGPQAIQLKVNGTTRPVLVEPRTTLLAALRDQLGLTGSKEVCDRGQCGACTVLLDGRTVYSCSLLAIEAAGHEIRTVTGLGGPDKLQVVQQEFVRHDALMCGFCTPGFVVAATALLERNPSPTRDEIAAGLDGNVCRCGTYARVFEAVEAAAARLRGGG
ncbi:MAG: (2Fe-2S)-binding protein [Armatimonadetes bacterium]|nr:(2Fe-2S)-binding protein [Armatimonadota bacterium]